MIINIKHKNDLITLDLRIKQIRYLEDYKNRGFIHFINLRFDDIEAYTYLYNNHKDLFFKALKEDLKTNINKNILIKNFEVLK